jgi:DNA repair exonuclease SbcCD ATPase subunit
MNSLHNEVLMILGFQLTVGLPEIIICELGALILGFTIHFFWNSKKDLDLNNQPDQNTGISDNDNWKLKYYNDMDMQERAQQQLRERLTQAQDTERTMTLEIEENRSETDELREELEIVHTRLSEAEAQLKPPAATSDQPDLTNNYIVQLRLAQEKLTEHNNSITRLLEQTRLVEDSEKKTQELLHQNEDLHEQLRSSGQQLLEKEAEISHLRHQQKLAEEMGSRLDKVYEEYSTLQDKLLKLQNYLTQPHSRGTDYEELKDAYFKLGKEHDEMKLKYLSLREENQRLNRIIADTEEKLKEANFQRQQYQKRSAFLEELNHDLQEISEHNKKIESQLRRVSDMESLLTKITQSGLRDVL